MRKRHAEVEQNVLVLARSRAELVTQPRAAIRCRVGAAPAKGPPGALEQSAFERPETVA
jgi:hypothetical protein